MRETRDAQASIFDFYSKHEQAQQLRKLSELLDQNTIFVCLVDQDFKKKNIKKTGARGLSLESILRCLLLKQILGVSYDKLAFHLSDSPTYRTFVRIRNGRSPCKSALQATVRRISANTLQQINSS
ncbi:MAG: transposase [Granulosicoccus sp.]